MTAVVEKFVSTALTEARQRRPSTPRSVIREKLAKLVRTGRRLRLRRGHRRLLARPRHRQRTAARRRGALAARRVQHQDRRPRRARGALDRRRLPVLRPAQADGPAGQARRIRRSARLPGRDGQPVQALQLARPAAPTTSRSCASSTTACRAAPNTSGSCSAAPPTSCSTPAAACTPTRRCSRRLAENTLRRRRAGRLLRPGAATGQPDPGGLLPAAAQPAPRPGRRRPDALPVCPTTRWSRSCSTARRRIGDAYFRTPRTTIQAPSSTCSPSSNRTRAPTGGSCWTRRRRREGHRSRTQTRSTTSPTTLRPARTATMSLSTFRI